MRIALNDIGKQYGSHWIFQHVEASFEPGHIYPIIGNNGSGKSTLLQIISGFVTPNQGQVRIEIDAKELAVEEWYKHISIAAPYLDLFEEFTVEESILLHQKFKPLRDANAEDLMDEIDLLKHRKKTLKQLSSGMRQRLKLALAMKSESALLLLDEPCSNLDKHWISWYNEVLKLRMQDRITIVCSNSQEEELANATDEALDISATCFRG